MAHKIIIMHDKGEHSAGAPTPTSQAVSDQHQEVLEAAALQMARIGPRFFRAVKAMMVHNLELPEDVREMGETKMLVLHTLVKGKQLTSDLAKHFNVTNPTMTRIIDGLVDKGYVERHHAMGDRRCIFLQLTGEGQDMGKRVEQHFHDAIIRFLRPLTEGQLNDIVRAYNHLASLLPEANPDVADASAESSHMSRWAERALRREAMRQRHIGRHRRRNHEPRTI